MLVIMKNRLTDIEKQIKEKLELRNKIINNELRPLDVDIATELEPLELELKPLKIELEPLEVELKPLEVDLEEDLFKDLDFKGFEDINLEPFEVDTDDFKGFEDLDTDISNLFEDLNLDNNVFSSSKPLLIKSKMLSKE